MSSTPTEGRDYYFNDAGLLVMTEAAHYARGYCCGSRCLHCPFEYDAVTGLPGVEPPVTVRRAEPRDAPEVALLARQTFASTYAKYQEDIGANLVPYLAHSFDLGKVAASFAKADNAWWVAEDAAGRLWGYAKLSSEARDETQPGGMHLQRLYVRRRARGHGIGQALLQAVEAFAKTRGATHIWLTTLPVERAAAEFYPAMGYHFLEEVDYRLGSQTFALSVMEKPLPAQ